jgi:PAS domain S-box-containing protein
MRIMLVDDEADLADVAKEFLEMGGQMQVDVALTAMECLERVRHGNYDAVVSDYQMPRMDGLQLLKKLRHEGNHIPFILFTGKGREEVVIEALNSGADFYLQKGGHPAAQFVELAHKVRQAVHARQADSALLESERRFKGLFEMMNSAVAVYEVRGDGMSGRDYVIRDFNRKAQELEGKGKEAAVGRSLIEIRPRIDEYGIIPVFRRVWTSGEPAFFPAKVYIDDRFFNWYQSTVFRLPNGEIVSIYEDVTEKVRAEDTMRERQQKLDSLFRAAPVGMGFVKGRIYVEVNRRTEEMSGYSADELVGQSTRILYESEEEFLRVGRIKYEELDRTGVGTVETNWRRKDGTLLPIRLTSASIVPGDRSSGVCFIAVEVPRREAEATRG